MEGKKFVIAKIFKQMDKLKYTDAKMIDICGF